MFLSPYHRINASYRELDGIINEQSFERNTVVRITFEFLKVSNLIFQNANINDKCDVASKVFTIISIAH